jgi:hypothetical protein
MRDSVDAEHLEAGDACVEQGICSAGLKSGGA